MIRVPTLITLMLLTVSAATAETWWVEWTGDTYPETEGWNRDSSDPPAERWLEDGTLVIDSMADWWIWENYWYPLDGMMTLEEGETFIYEWRCKVDEAIPTRDPGVAVRSDDQFSVIFRARSGQHHELLRRWHIRGVLARCVPHVSVRVL